MEIKKYRKNKAEIIDKRNYLNETLKNFKILQHRASCPYCEQHINRIEYKNKVPIIQEELDEVLKELEIIIAKIKPLEIIIRKTEKIERQEHKKEVEEFYRQYKGKIYTAFRDYHKSTINSFKLPDLFDKKNKLLWNEAMQIFFDRNNKFENDELLFEIKED